jgi:hypothetical protein
MIPDAKLQEIVRAIHAEKDFYGCIIGYYGENQSQVLHEGIVPAIAYSKVVVIIELTPLVDVGPMSPDLPAEMTEVEVVPPIVTNKSRLVPELVGAVASCGLTGLSALGMVAGAAAEVPTGGASTALVILGWTGVATSGLQCINGIVRSAEAIANPDSDSLEQWDKNDVYKWSFLIIDGVGVATSVVGMAAGMKNLWAILERRGGLMAADKMANLSRAERAEAVRRAIAQASQTPEGKAAVAKALKEAKLKPNQVKQAMTRGVSTVRLSKKAMAAVSADAASRVFKSTRDILAGVAGLGVSASSSKYTGSGSGSLNAIIMHFVEKQKK